jgi:adenine-specific DNA-methyltransferase
VTSRETVSGGVPLPEQIAASPHTHAYLQSQLITCIGNKRHLLAPIEHAVEVVKADVGSDRLRMADLFSGSGVVSRLFMYFADELHANDLERYATVLNTCYLSPRPAPLMTRLRAAHRSIVAQLDEQSLVPGIVAEHYAPEDDNQIQPGERVFYTRRNACFLDTARTLIGNQAKDLQPFLLGPLLVQASVHTNTAGVFKGFYKDRNTGIGKFGGAGADAIDRITGKITLPFPVGCQQQPVVVITNVDANELVGRLPPLDLVYIDPPYNQHPYGSNYFMLNLLCDYTLPERISRISGIPEDWQRSDYNRKRLAESRLEHLLRTVDSSHVLLSFNSEGFIGPERMMRLLRSVGSVEVQTMRYPTFRGSRNLASRSLHVHELLYLIRKAG